MQGVSFDSDMLVLPIGGCNMVLGVQWLITLGDIMWNFKQLKMEFSIEGHKMSLRGIKPPAAKVIQQNGMAKLLAKPAELYMISVGMYLGEEYSEESGSLFSISSCGTTEKDSTDMQKLLQDFSDLFEVSTELSPSRNHDHKIVLKEGTSPINIRPYKYPVIQKNEIEKLVLGK